ncbi:hypothetical protein P154DRAFT_450420, partial [Amniculicola lignicola CBS 123094]
PAATPQPSRSHPIAIMAVHELPATQQALKVAGANQVALHSECPLPALHDDEVLVRVRCASINPVDVKMLDLAPHVGATAGCEFAGDVVAVGAAVRNQGVRVGVAVFGCVCGNHPERSDNGAYADYVAVPGDLVYLLPPHLTYAQGASLGAAMPTVGMALYSTWPLPLPQSAQQHPTRAATGAADGADAAAAAAAAVPAAAAYVLVYGASTACGALALQMLRHSGLVPVAVCSPANFAMVAARGADAAFDYHDAACADNIRRHTRNALAYVLDCIADVASMKICYAAMGAAGGRYMGLNPFPLRAHTRRDVRPDYVLVYTIFGQAMKLPRPFGRPARPKDRAFAEAWYRSSQLLVDTAGALLPHPIRPGTGLADIVSGLDCMRQAKLSGTKLARVSFCSSMLCPIQSCSSAGISLFILSSSTPLPSLHHPLFSALVPPTHTITMPAASTHTAALPNTRGNSTEPSRKRRRQAVVCTECRRRKIACDRNMPCAQCVQSKSTCTFYNSYNSHSDGDQARSLPDGQRASQPEATPVIGQTAYPNQTSPQLSLAPMASDRNPFACTTRPSPITVSTNTTSITGINGTTTTTTTMDVPPFPMTMYPDPDHVQFPPSLFTDMPDFNGATSMTDLTPISIDAPVRSSSSTLTDSGTLFHKSRVYGPSHWMSLLGKHDLFDDIKSILFTGEANTMLSKCKSLARVIKSSSRPSPQLLARPLSDLIPNKETADRLVKLYLRTFETVFSIMHIPTFQQDYVEHWNNPQATKDPFLIQLLLIMTIGTCFCPTPSAPGATKAQSKLRDQSLQWIHATHARLTSPMAKQDLSLCGIQNHCLLLLALMTDTQAVGGDLAWIAIGSLMQRAMAIGLHLKPSQLPVSALEAETRRRIWTTILELSVQSSLDSGTYPIIPQGALDNFEPPFNLDDSQLTASTQTPPSPQPTTTFTRSSIQCALVKSLPIRFKIAEALNQPPHKLTYDNVRSMGAELTAHLRETSQLIKDTASLMWRRIQRGETSIKAFVFITCVLAKIDASRNCNFPQQKNHIDQAVADTAKQVLDVCAKFFASRLSGTSSPSSSEPDEHLALKEQATDLDQWLPWGDRDESDELELQNSLSTNIHIDHTNDMDIWLNDNTNAWKFPTWGNEPMFT